MSLLPVFKNVFYFVAFFSIVVYKLILNVNISKYSKQKLNKYDFKWLVSIDLLFLTIINCNFFMFFFCSFIMRYKKPINCHRSLVILYTIISIKVVGFSFQFENNCLLCFVRYYYYFFLCLLIHFIILTATNFPLYRLPCIKDSK